MSLIKNIKNTVSLVAHNKLNNLIIDSPVYKETNVQNGKTTIYITDQMARENGLESYINAQGKICKPEDAAVKEATTAYAISDLNLLKVKMETDLSKRKKLWNEYKTEVDPKKFEDIKDKLAAKQPNKDDVFLVTNTFANACGLESEKLENKLYCIKNGDFRQIRAADAERQPVIWNKAKVDVAADKAAEYLRSIPPEILKEPYNMGAIDIQIAAGNKGVTKSRADVAKDILNVDDSVQTPNVLEGPNT